MQNPSNMQFFEGSHRVQEESWGGAENKVSSIAFHTAEDTPIEDVEFTHVIKEPREENYFEILAKEFPPRTDIERDTLAYLTEYFDSKEHFINSKRDFTLMKAVFGELVPRTQYIIGEPREGNPQGFYILQERINGKTWTEFSKNKPTEMNREYMMQHRDQLISLIGGARKILIETGASVDIWGDNIMVDEDGNFILIDPGSPSEFVRHYDHLLKLPKDMRTLLATNIVQRVTDLQGYPEKLEMTYEEIQKMNEKFGFTEEEYEEASRTLLSKCEVLAE